MDWVVIGRFGRPHGIKGFVTVHSFTYPQDNILEYKTWYAFLGKQWQPITILEQELRINNLLVKIEGYSERESAAELTNIEIAIPGSQLAVLKPDEYYWHELIGMTVVNQQGQSFGKVQEIMATGSNDVLVVQGEKRYLIPYLPGEFVLQINKEQKQITVDWDLDF